MSADLQELEHDPSLVAWRRKATDVVIIAGVLLHFVTVIVPVVLMRANMSTVIFGVLVGGWLGTVAAAVLRRLDHRTRVWLFIAAMYLASLIGSLEMPDGPTVRAWPIFAPILAIGLVGRHAGRVATGISAVVLLAPPIILSSPLVAELNHIGLWAPAQTSTFLLAQGPVLIAEMLIVMLLLDRLHDYLLRSMASERRAAEDQAAEHERLETALQEQVRLERDLATVGDEERRRLGSDLHDGVSQQLAGALLRCQALEIALERGSIIPAEDVRALSSLLDRTIAETHVVAKGLWPLDATPMALVAGLGRLARQAGELQRVPCDFQVTGRVELDDPVVAQHLFRIAQEALGNAVQHARARRVVIHLGGDDEAVTLRIEDDGSGFDPGVATGGLGLRTMTHRARLIGASLDLTSASGEGTTIVCRVPRSPQPDHRTRILSVEEARPA